MITIKNDTGLASDTRVIGDDGADLCKAMFVDRLSFEVAPDQICRATIHVGIVKTETKCGKVEWLTRNPISGNFEAVQSITFSDGSAVVLHNGGATTVPPPPKRVQPIGDGNRYEFRGSDT